MTPAPGSSNCIWKSVGPINVNGRVTSIAIASGNSDVMFVASVGGIWRSVDHARRWRRVLEAARPGVFGAVAIDATGDVVYAGGGDPNYEEVAWGGGPGIWRSSDQGDNWVHESVAGLDHAVVFKLIVDPADPNHAYAATSTGVWVRSGVSWSRLSGMDAPCSDIAVDFSSPSPKVYAGVYQDTQTFPRGVWKYVTSWQATSHNLFSQCGLISLAMAPSDPQLLYAKLQKENSDKALAVLRTTNGGSKWVKRSGLTQKPDFAWYNNVIAVSPADPKVVWIGLIDLYQSQDGATTWTERKKGPFPEPNALQLHVDQHALAFDPANPNVIFVGNDGGLFRSSDQSAQNEHGEVVWHWEGVSHGMVITEFYRIATIPAQASLVGGGTQDNATAFTFGNRTWYSHLGCDGGYVAVDAGNLLGVYESCDGNLMRYGNPVPGRSSWQNTIVQWPQTFADPHDPVTTDVGKPGHAAAVSWPNHSAPQMKFTTDNGNTWSDMGDPFPDDATVTALAVAPDGKFETFYVGYRDSEGGAGVWATTNRGQTWTRAAGFPNLSPNSLAVDRSTPGRAFVALGGEEGSAGGIWRTTDTGVSWNAVNGSGVTGLPEAPMTGVVIDPSDPYVIYASSSVGIFKGTIAEDGSANWVPFDEGLPEGLDVNDIAVNEANQTLIIGTKGYGAFSRYIGSNACPSTRLIARDNVFDLGEGPALIGQPNPEDPVDLDADGLWAANSGPDATLNWWSSTDIRVAIKNPAATNLPAYDPVEFETCPIWSDLCPPGMLKDASPQPGDQARVYVQVSNTGLTRLSHVKVTALWWGGSIPAPALPNEFWSQGFRAGLDCGSLATTSGWRFVNENSPCTLIDTVEPGQSEIVGFDWNVPTNASVPFQYLAVIQADQAPLGPARSVFAMDLLVPRFSQTTLRALKVLELFSGSALRAADLVRINAGGAQETQFTVSFAGRRTGEELRLLVPPGSGVIWTGAVRDTASDSLATAPGHFASFEGFHADSVAHGTIPPGASLDLGLIMFPGPAGVDRPRFLNLAVRQAGRLLGGMTWVVKPDR